MNDDVLRQDTIDKIVQNYLFSQKHNSDIVAFVMNGYSNTYNLIKNGNDVMYLSSGTKYYYNPIKLAQKYNYLNYRIILDLKKINIFVMYASCNKNLDSLDKNITECLLF